MRYIRKDLQNLKPYRPVIAPHTIKLDANEGKNYLMQKIVETNLVEELLDVNLYPDNNAAELKAEIAKFIGIPVEQIQVGNGSNEILELIMKTFLEPKDKVMSFEPTFSMYAQFVKVYGGTYIGIDDFSFEFPMDTLIERAKEEQPKIILICNPNNPTGLLIPKEDVLKLIESTDSLVVVDEAYMDFSNQSIVEELDKFKNVIILRTVSKALGMAGIRMGYALSCVELIDDLDRVRSPYNLNVVSQIIAKKALAYPELIADYVDEVVEEREFVFEGLKNQGVDVFKSAANFVFFKHDYVELQEYMQTLGILIRKFQGKLNGYYRVTIGSHDENVAFLKAMKEV